MIRILCRRAGREQVEPLTPEQLTEALADQASVIWIDLALSSGNVDEACSFLGRYFHFHPLAIEDALIEVHLARVDDWQQYLYLAFHALELKDHQVVSHELDLFLGRHYLVTIHFDPIPVLERMWEQVAKATNPGHTYSAERLLYYLFDKLTTETLNVVDQLDTEMDDLEQAVYARPERRQLARLFRLRRTVLQLRRIFGSQREMMNRLARDDFPIIRPESRVYFRDIYDHLIRMHELTDGLRDMASGALESHISVTSYRMNEVMRTLTVVTVLFMPITFITGFFGMNFFADAFNVPNPFPPVWLFLVTLTVLVALPPTMLLWMGRKGWLQSHFKPERIPSGRETNKEPHAQSPDL
jgi:magnesium transporter